MLVLGKKITKRFTTISFTISRSSGKSPDDREIVKLIVVNLFVIFFPKTDINSSISNIKHFSKYTY